MPVSLQKKRKPLWNSQPARRFASAAFSKNRVIHNRLTKEITAAKVLFLRGEVPFGKGMFNAAFLEFVVSLDR